MQNHSMSNLVSAGMVMADSAKDWLPDNQFDWIMFGLLAFIVGGILVAIGFYLRSAYRKGGWQRLGRDLGILIAVLAIWAVKAALRQFLK